MQKTFDNKLVLVTGGAGALGQGVVSWYSDRGARVAVLDYSDEILASAFPTSLRNALLRSLRPHQSRQLR